MRLLLQKACITWMLYPRRANTEVTLFRTPGPSLTRMLRVWGKKSLACQGAQRCFTFLVDISTPDRALYFPVHMMPPYFRATNRALRVTSQLCRSSSSLDCQSQGYYVSMLIHTKSRLTMGRAYILLCVGIPFGIQHLVVPNPMRVSVYCIHVALQ